MRRSARLKTTSEAEEEASSPAASTPPVVAAPKKPKRLPLKHRPRPEYPYELIHKMPVTEHKPDYSELGQPLSVSQSKSLGMSVHMSRLAYLSGAMFNTTTVRKQMSRIDAPETSVPLTRLGLVCDAVFIMGLHRFAGKLCTASEDDSPLARPRPGGSRVTDMQAVIRKLQQMAREDAVLATLMAEVATGHAPAERVAEFQKYIQKAKELLEQEIKAAEVKGPKEGDAKEDPQSHISLAIEFSDNPGEHFVLPRDSIIELLANTDILVSFLHVEKGYYTPLTITLKGVPAYKFQLVEQCFEAPALARKHMTDKMHVYTRSKSYHVWYQVDKTDALVLDHIHKTHPPHFAMAPVKRQPKRKVVSKYPTARPTPRSNPLGNTLEEAPKPAPEPPRPKLNLPDINSFKMPAGEMPPLPKSLQGLVKK